jgi:hypothetical protein
VLSGHLPRFLASGPILKTTYAARKYGGRGMLYHGNIWLLLFIINELPETQNLFAGVLSHNHVADVKKIAFSAKFLFFSKNTCAPPTFCVFISV